MPTSMSFNYMPVSYLSYMYFCLSFQAVIARSPSNYLVATVQPNQQPIAINSPSILSYVPMTSFLNSYPVPCSLVSDVYGFHTEGNFQTLSNIVKHCQNLTIITIITIITLCNITIMFRTYRI